MKPMRLVLINDTSGISNWGAQLTIHALHSIITQVFPGCTIEPIPQSTLVGKYIEFQISTRHQLILGEDSWLVRFPGIRTLVKPRFFSLLDTIFPANENSLERKARWWKSNQDHPIVSEWVSTLGEADLVVHNAELLNYNLNPVSSGGMFLLWIAKTQLGKPAGVINQTTPSLDGDQAMIGLLRRICPELDLVTVREPRSQRAMDHWGIPSTLIPDPSFTLGSDWYDQEAFENWKDEVGIGEQPYFCVSLSSGLPVAGGKAGLVQLIRELQKVIPSVVLMSFGGGAWLFNRIQPLLENSYLFRGSFRGVWPLLRDARFLLSGHYHNIIMAAQVGTPFIPFSSVSHKMKGLLELLEWPYPRLFNPTAFQLEMQGIAQQCIDLLAQRGELSLTLRERVKLLSELSTETGNKLQEMMTR
jgi:hypothetical protein